MRTVAPLALAVLAAAVAVPGAAQAGTPLTITSIKAYGTPVIVPGKQTKVPVKVVVKGTKVTDVDVTLKQVNGRGFALISNLKRSSGSAANGVWQGTAVLDQKDWGGRYTIEAAATDGKSKDPYFAFVTAKSVGSLIVHRSAKLNAVATPASVRKGQKFQVRGRLLVFGAKNAYVPLRRQEIEIWFKAKGKKAVKVAVVTTNTKGRYSRTFKATVDGSMAARYAGTLYWQKRVTGWAAVDVM